MRPALLAPLLLTLCAALGCGSPPGEECELTSGALGFGFKDDCKGQCLALWDVTCPDGSSIRRAVCSGREGCDPGSCPDGQVCYSFEDPFDEDFYCIPADFCGAAPATQEALLAWELESRQRSDALRAKFKERMDRRTGKPTAPAEDLQPTPAPQ